MSSSDNTPGLRVAILCVLSAVVMLAIGRMVFQLEHHNPLTRGLNIFFAVCFVVLACIFFILAGEQLIKYGADRAIRGIQAAKQAGQLTAGQQLPQRPDRVSLTIIWLIIVVLLASLPRSFRHE